jgi:hypothetical protein
MQGEFPDVGDDASCCVEHQIYQDMKLETRCSEHPEQLEDDQQAEGYAEEPEDDHFHDTYPDRVKTGMVQQNACPASLAVVPIQ